MIRDVTMMEAVLADPSLCERESEQRLFRSDDYSRMNIEEAAALEIGIGKNIRDGLARCLTRFAHEDPRESHMREPTRK